MIKNVLLNLTTDFILKQAVQKAHSKINVLFCLSSSNVILMKVRLPNFYIIVKSNFSSLLPYNLFCYLCCTRVRNQQNISKVQNKSMESFIPNLWLADSTLEARNSKQDHLFGDLDVNLLCSMCSVGLLCFAFNQSQLSEEFQHPMKCILTFSPAAIVYLCCILLVPDSGIT